MRETSEAGENAMMALRSARGEYAAEDAAMHRWFEDRKTADNWPPRSPQSDLAFGEDSDEEN